ncbi:16633_t:CDS:2 [Dentiscutata heterogama]|uniref:16633_t:CDS:1 n=1 Tax=Dentiscutata heterogama TaxID=1316150 RepID=A0ACA9N7P8_9GLOM|nr:16633_t:CDS:2 [Dentiscutata heterogama]
MTKRKQNNNSTSSDTETDSRNLSNPKSGCPLTGPTTLRAHFANSYKNIFEEWKYHFNYILVNNLEDIPTDEPLYGMPNTTSFLVKQKKSKIN